MWLVRLRMNEVGSQSMKPEVIGFRLNNFSILRLNDNEARKLEKSSKNRVSIK